MTSVEVAELLGITLNNLRQIQHRKQLTYVSKLGRKVYYRREDVARFQAIRQEKNGRP
jgi:DNA-binding transcriptional MerR regulator